MIYVCDLLAAIAINRNVAVDAPHHTRKGLMVAGDANAGGGSSSVKDAVRLVYTLTPMTSDEAKQFKIPETDRRGYVRMDSGKVNIAPPSRQAKWFRIVGVPWTTRWSGRPVRGCGWTRSGVRRDD
jgi:hypothetical protein